MKRVLALLAVVAVLSATATGVLVWRLTRHQGPDFPEISAFTDGQLTRIGPYRYCDVHLKACDIPATTGELHVTARHPIQLSVPQPVARAPWVLSPTTRRISPTRVAWNIQAIPSARTSPATKRTLTSSAARSGAASAASTTSAAAARWPTSTR